jgi:hypothetical protein
MRNGGIFHNKSAFSLVEFLESELKYTLGLEGIKRVFTNHQYLYRK